VKAHGDTSPGKNADHRCTELIRPVAFDPLFSLRMADPAGRDRRSDGNAGSTAAACSGLTGARPTRDVADMFGSAPAVDRMILLGVSLSMPLSSCAYIGALGRTTNRLLSQSIDDQSREAMFGSLREIHREGGIEAVTPHEEDSTP